MKKTTTVGVTLALLALAGATAAQTPQLIRCGYTERHDCSAGTCSEAPSDALRDRYLMLPTLQDGRMAGPAQRHLGTSPARALRCDASGCSGHNVEYVESGVYASYVQPEGTWMFRIYSVDALPDFLKDGTEPVPGDFVEIATLGLDVLMYRGSCPALLDP